MAIMCTSGQWIALRMREEKSRTEHCGVETRKFGERVVEREDFGRADKGEVTR
jgi:hypothetical protein